MCIGVLLILTPYISTPKSSSIQTQASSPIVIDAMLLEESTTTDSIKHIMLPTSSIDLPVVEAPIVDGYWEVSETTASHGSGSSYPGESGNIVIFAHARDGLFLPLREAEIGESIYLLTAQTWRLYRITEKKEVAPADTEVIAQTPEETLTLFTCSGFLDSMRTVVTAKPI